MMKTRSSVFDKRIAVSTINRTADTFCEATPFFGSDSRSQLQTVCIMLNRAFLFPQKILFQHLFRNILGRFAELLRVSFCIFRQLVIPFRAYHFVLVLL